jgi:hypothetical protein
MTYTKQHGLTQNAISSLCAGRDGSVWIGTWGGGLDQAEGRNHHHLQQEQRAFLRFCRGACRRPGTGRFGSGTAYARDAPGLDRLKEWANQPATGCRRNTSAPPSPSCCEDRQGNMWAGSRNGLGLFQAGRIHRLRRTERGLTNRPVSMRFAPAATAAFGLARKPALIRWSNGRFDSLGGQKSGPKTHLSSPFTRTRQGELWIGTLGEGLVRLANGNRRDFFDPAGAAQ